MAGGLGQQHELLGGGGFKVPFAKIGLHLTLGMLDRSVISSLIHRAVDRDHHGFLKDLVHRGMIQIAGVVAF